MDSLTSQIDQATRLGLEPDLTTTSSELYGNKICDNDDRDDNSDSSIELPSCLESLSSSSEQLQEIANQVGQYCIKWVLCYGYVTDSNDLSRKSPVSKDDIKPASSPALEQLDILSKDQTRLQLLEATVEALPKLNDLCTLIEKSFLTIESTLKRCTYYMNKMKNHVNNNHGNSNLDMEPRSGGFQLTVDARLDSIFVGLMDVIYAMVSLDKTIQLHAPGISAGLSSLVATCELVVQSTGCPVNLDDGGGIVNSQLPGGKVKNLMDYVRNIQLTLCNPTRSLFQQCLEHLQHLNLHLSRPSRTSKGYGSLCKVFDDFIEFYGEHLIEFDSSHGLISPTELAPHQTTVNTNMRQLKSRALMLIHLNMVPTIYMTTMPCKLLGLSILYILYNWTFKRPNKRLTRIMMQTLHRFKGSNVVHLLGSNCYILLDEFLAKHLPKSVLDIKTLKQLANFSAELWLIKSNTVDEFERLTMKTLPWLVKFKAEVKSTTEANKNEFSSLSNSKQFNLINQGLLLADEINYSIKSFITIYLHFNKPMAKNQLVHLFRMIALLKSIDECLSGEQIFVDQCLINSERFIRGGWQQIMTRLRKRLVSLRFSERKMDTLSSLQLTSICSSLSHNLMTAHSNRTIISLSLPMLITSLNSEELSYMNGLMSFIYPLPAPTERLMDLANCGYLYWSWPTLGAYYNYALEEDPCAFNELKYLHMAINDIPSLFKNADNCLTLSGVASCQAMELGNLIAIKRDEFLKKLGSELINQFKVDFLDKLCQELEIELRLQTHRELHLDGHNPFRRHLYNFKMIFSPTSQNFFRLFDEQVSMRHYIEQHLNRICYNLTAIAPHDWSTYDSMINLAKLRYNLNLANTQLPTQSLDCGLDLLDITRHLTLFISRYGYDLINQVFIEKCSNRLSSSSAASVFSGGGVGGANSLISASINVRLNLNLNVVQVKHISKSIQTHGYGVLNSSVNRTYQVMKRLVNLFARQMADDKLRATLTKEQQAISSGRQSGVSFDKATRMARKFRLSSAGTSQQQQTSGQHVGLDLDSLRQCITQLGNLLGFIRMLKSGALSCATRTADYLPDMENFTIGLSKLVKNYELAGTNSSARDCLYRASENFDQCLADLEDNFSPKTNYFGIVINLFKQSFIGEEGEKEVYIGEQLTRENRPEEVDQIGGSVSSSTPIKTKYENRDNEGGGEDLDKQKPKLGNLKDRANKRDCLSLFFVLVPSLTINYIDYIINCKERAQSRSSATRFGALISDDGFPMGVAFLLTVLGQVQGFAKLEWFKEIGRKLVADMDEVEQRVQGSSYEESLRQTSSMTLRRLNRLQVEYNGLSFALSSALLFFRSSSTTLLDQASGHVEFSNF